MVEPLGEACTGMRLRSRALYRSPAQRRRSGGFLDLRSAVTANAENFAVDESHRIAQADILKLPFPAQQFDVAFCLGVIQHTPKPEETIASLFSHVAPGRALIIDHYTYEIGWYTKSAPLFRAILKRLP
jgi:SAM-dependent methyltransferase